VTMLQSLVICRTPLTMVDSRGAGEKRIGAVEDCAAHGRPRSPRWWMAVGLRRGSDAVVGKAKERRMVEEEHRGGMRIVGPNSQGLTTSQPARSASFSTMVLDLDRPRGHVAMSARAARVHGAGRISSQRRQSESVIPRTGNDAGHFVGELAVAVAEDPR